MLLPNVKSRSYVGGGLCNKLFIRKKAHSFYLFADYPAKKSVADLVYGQG